MLSSLQNWQIISNPEYPDEPLASNETISWQDSTGPLTISRVDLSGEPHYRLRLGDALAVDVLPDRQLVARSRSNVSKATHDHFLADQVFPRIMAHEGACIVHAGAIRAGDGAILVMGSSGRGKSTLVTSFDQAGCALLGDDAMIISWHEVEPCVKAVYPSLRLLPDSIEALFPGPVATTSIADYTPKQRINLPVADHDVALPLPIRAIFVIADPTAGVQIHLRRLTIAQACMVFVESSFALDPTDLPRARERLADASALARQVSAFEITYPRDYARLPEVRQAILDQVAALEPA